MGETAYIKACAKINLALAVLGRRPDGFHAVETVMQSVSLADTLVLRPRRDQGWLFRCTDREIDSEDNLVCRAARALEEAAGASLPGVEITLYKTIPREAGLGGGSSDAAAALTTLNRYWKLGLNRGELARLGASLGSDVPFFLHGPTALARGRGELITPLPPLPFFWVVLALPAGLSLPTAAVYRSLPDPLPSPPDLGPLLKAIGAGEGERVAAWLANGSTNTLAGAVLPRHPEVGALLDTLAGFGIPAAMSGSGPAVFGLTRSWREARSAARRLQEDGNRSYLCWVEPSPPAASRELCGGLKV